MLTETQKHVLSYLVTALKREGIVFQASGGLAAIAHGATRPLYDIDLEIHKEDVEKARALFKEYITEDWDNDLDGPDDEFDIWMMKLQVGGVPVDINQIEEIRIRQKGGEWVEQPSEMDSELKVVEGIELPVLKKEPLIAYKQILGRDTDLEDIRQLN